MQGPSGIQGERGEPGLPGNEGPAGDRGGPGSPGTQGTPVSHSNLARTQLLLSIVFNDINKTHWYDI